MQSDGLAEQGLVFDDEDDVGLGVHDGQRAKIAPVPVQCKKRTFGAVSASAAGWNEPGQPNRRSNSASGTPYRPLACSSRPSRSTIVIAPRAVSISPLPSR